MKTLLAFIPLVIVSCIPNPAQQAADGQALYACVQNDWGKPFPTVVADCAKDAPAVIADVIADIWALTQSATDGGTPAASFPYAQEPAVSRALPAAMLRHARTQ